jgi:alpha-beta hydrolase superfamily lysophospholipase
MAAYERIPYLIMFDDRGPYKDTYAGEIGRVVLKSHLLRPESKSSDTVTLFMHPVGGGEYLPMPIALAKAGHHVIYCQSRYPNNDSALIMEKVAMDMAACVRDAKERLGYEKVVLAGWSGGGSLSLFYQSQAENPTVTATPAGDPPDLTRQDFIPADGIMLLAAHVGRSHTLTHWMDASILDESDPEKKDPELDLYDALNPNQPPYTPEFVARYRDAQFARNRRITAWVHEKLGSFRATGKPHQEFGFVVHGTMADPKWLDPTIDPNDRKPRWCFLGEPEVVNNGPVGLARFCTLRSWLSQWSYDESNADGIRCAAHVSIPALVLGNSADDGCTPADTNGLHDALASTDKERVEIQGANHYYFGQPDHLKEAVSKAGAWLESKGFAG